MASQRRRRYRVLQDERAVQRAEGRGVTVSRQAEGTAPATAQRNDRAKGT